MKTLKILSLSFLQSMILKLKPTNSGERVLQRYISIATICLKNLILIKGEGLILAIEVDGFKYHKQNFKQINRDQIKNIILEKIGLPLLRLSTTGANEEERIKSKINEIIK